MNATGDYATHEMDSCCQPNSTHLSYDEALQVLDNHCRDIPLKTEQIPLAEAVHRVLAKDVVPETMLEYWRRCTLPANR